MSARGSFKRITPQGLLSFAPNFEGINLGPLNVLIGPNGSGKSNFIDVISVLAACPKDFTVPIRATGGIQSWLHSEAKDATGFVEAIVSLDGQSQDHFHSIVVESNTGSTRLKSEQLLTLERSSTDRIPRQIIDWVASNYKISAEIENSDPFGEDQVAFPWDHESSVLSKLRSSLEFPLSARLADFYQSIFMFGQWQSGRNSILRHPQTADASRKRLEPDFSNLALILNQFQLKPTLKAELISKLKDLYPEISGFEIEVVGGTMQIFVTEGQRNIPASRLSDGTLKYLCLLALLCDPSPPPVICLEEPETGLHPDLIVNVARLLKEASSRTQIIVTTHSEVLVDALTESPEDIIVCEKVDGQTQMKRLSKEYLAPWLENYSLGDLWTRGTLGGNRW